MPISYVAPSAAWFAKAPEPTDLPTPNAGAIHFDGLNGGNSFTILGADQATPVGHGFLSAGRIYTHFGFAEQPNAGEWLFYRVTLNEKTMVVHSPILEADKVVLPVTGTYTERVIENARLAENGDENQSWSFFYTRPDGTECELMQTSPRNWLSDQIHPVLVNVSTYEDFLLLSYSPRAEGDTFPVEDFLYTIVANRQTGKFLGQGIRREYYAMSSRFDSYIELGTTSLGPVGEHDWWPVFYHDIWQHALHNTKQPLWTFAGQAITVSYPTGHAGQRFVLD